MRVSGHKTRSVFDRYDITDDDDLADVRERTRPRTAYAKVPGPLLLRTGTYKMSRVELEPSTRCLREGAELNHDTLSECLLDESG